MRDDDDFPLPMVQDEWTWIDDVVTTFRIVITIVFVLGVSGAVIWQVLK